ncbi:MAG: preprotein translocase subunit SecG [Armatimonadota bacterium]
MQVLQSIFMVVAVISGIALIVSIMLQTSKAESFSAAMGGGGDQGRFRKGSREEMLDRITKYSAIVWILACALNAVFWYRIQG